MLKPPGPTIPGMTDTLDFVKNLWGSMHLPGAGLSGMSAIPGPPLSTEDLDKRIADLKAVESWLNLNLSMLRGSIQALEVQRGTLATLKTMSASMAEAMRQSGVSAEKMAAMPFAPFFGQPGMTGMGGKPADAPAASSPAASGNGNGNGGASAGAKGAPGGAAAQPGAATPPPGDPLSDGAAAAAAAMGMPAAMAWWNMLQDQFTQAVNAAMGPAAAAASAANQDGHGAPKAQGNGDKAAAEPAGSGAPDPEAQAADPKAGVGAAGKARASRPKSDKA